MVGKALLVAPDPSPDEIASYEVTLPPGTWYDYWSGERFERSNKIQARDLEQRDKLNVNKPVLIQPRLEMLPVYVRGGNILPLEPVTQSTEEKPVGPLTLRVYLAADPNTPCTGEVYTDDGHSFGYREGNYARVGFSCSLAQDGSLAVQVAPQEGSFEPWWKQYRLEIFGWTPKVSAAALDKVSVPLQRNSSSWSVTIPANVRGEIVQVR